MLLWQYCRNQFDLSRVPNHNKHTRKDQETQGSYTKTADAISVKTKNINTLYSRVVFSVLPDAVTEQAQPASST